MSLRTVVSAALLGLCLSLSFAQAAEPPTTASVQHSLDKIAERKLPEADQKALQQVLEQTLGLLASRDDYDKRLAALKQQLADAIGVSRKTISTVETSRFTPSVVIALQMAHYFEVPVEQIFSFDGFR